MSADLIRSFYRAAASNDASALRQILAPNWVETPSVYPGQPAGPEGYIPIVGAFSAAFPDGAFHVHEILESGAKYTVRTTFQGTHKGPFLGVESTGRAISFDTIDIHELRDGQVIASWHIEDFFGLYQQLTSKT